MGGVGESPGDRERLVAHGIVLKAWGGDMGEGQGGFRVIGRPAAL